MGIRHIISQGVGGHRVYVGIRHPFAKASLKGELQEVSKGNSHIYALLTKALDVL